MAPPGLTRVDERLDRASERVERIGEDGLRTLRGESEEIRHRLRDAAEGHLSDLRHEGEVLRAIAHRLRPALEDVVHALAGIADRIDPD